MFFFFFILWGRNRRLCFSTFLCTFVRVSHWQVTVRYTAAMESPRRGRDEGLLRDFASATLAPADPQIRHNTRASSFFFILMLLLLLPSLTASHWRENNTTEYPARLWFIVSLKGNTAVAGGFRGDLRDANIDPDTNTHTHACVRKKLTHTHIHTHLCPSG